jgi:hypothetical protein
MKLENMVPYKTIICKRWKNEGHCYHPNCLYAHGENELCCDEGYSNKHKHIFHAFKLSYDNQNRDVLAK